MSSSPAEGPETARLLERLENAELSAWQLSRSPNSPSPVDYRLRKAMEHLVRARRELTGPPVKRPARPA